MSANKYDLIVIGSGPGGYVGAIKAAQNGLKVAIVEKRTEGHLGGTCLNVGCIPTKALLASAKTFDKLKHADTYGFTTGKIEYDWSKVMGRKDKIVDQQRKGLQFLMKKNKIDVHLGHGRFKSKTTVEVSTKEGTKTLLEAKNIMIATGSDVKELPFAKSNNKNILNSDHILSVGSVPESLAVIGGGVVGTEFASLFGRMGSKVVIIEMADQILPTEDFECAKEMVKHLKKQNVSVEAATKLTGIKDNGDHCVVSVEGKEDRKFSKVLMSIGRAPVTADLGLEAVGISTERGGFLKVDENYRTAVANIFAIGDVIPTPALAHTASAEAIYAADFASGLKPQALNYDANPSALYCWPEIASIGKTEQALKADGVDYKVSKFPFAPMAKAKIEGADFGFVKLIFDPKHGEILGAHIIGATATEMIAELSLGKVLETTIDEIGHTIHPHPTLSETIMEAAHGAHGKAIHM